MYLLTQAKEAGVGQAILHPVRGGYLEGDRISLDLSDSPPPKLPQCLELIGEPALLEAFLEVNRHLLNNVRVVRLQGDETDWDQEPESLPAPE